MKKFYNIQALRSVAVLLVVVFHFAGIEQIYGQGPNLFPRFTDIGASGVDIFFVISGFIMSTITRGQFENFKNAFTFLFHRITRIYPLYWFYTIVFLVSLLISDVIQRKTSVKFPYDYLPAFLLLPQNAPNILAVSWTLIYEIYFYFVMAVLLFFPERFFIKLILL